MARPADPHARRSLTAAARREFARRGIVGARIEDITAACNLSKGAFYLHFKSKELLFGELVADFTKGMDEMLERRKAQTNAFFSEHGKLSARDIHARSERYEQLVALEAKLDRELLSMLWEYRDVVAVLLSGAQGTGFSGLVWEIAHKEVQRVQDEFAATQQFGACRTDVPAAVFGSMVVGTWMLVAQQMSRMQSKPDLDQWALALHHLIREGCAPPIANLGKVAVRRRLAARISRRPS